MTRPGASPRPPDQVLYLDTSAFLKLLVDEEHSAPLRQHLAGEPAWSSTLLDVEAHRAAQRLGIDEATVVALLRTVTLVVPDETTYATARSLRPASLRTLDALHLAAALELGGDLAGVVSYDARLATGCEANGVPVVAPGLSDRWWATP